MFSMMRVEKLKGNEEKNKIDRVALMYKDFVAMYEIYAKLKIAKLKIATSAQITTPTSNTKVAFTSDPDFFVGQQLDNQKSQLANFIQFINWNNHYLNTILHIFNSENPQENREKCEKYVKQCEMTSRFVIGDELAKNWFFALGQLMKWCATVADLQYLLNLIDDENSEWTTQKIAKASSAREMLPKIFGATLAKEMLKPRGRPRSEHPKERINIRLSHEVIEHFKSSGDGWQTRVDAALCDWLKTHSRN